MPTAKTHRVDPVAQVTEFIFKYDGKPNEINAATFLESLAGVTGTLQECNRVLGTGDPLDIKIRAPRPGSFLVHLLLDPVSASAIAALFTAANIEAAKGLIGALAQLFELRKLLKGDKPAKTIEGDDNSITVENSQGNTIIVDRRVYNLVAHNSVVNANLDRTFTALDSDARVEAVEILDSAEKRLQKIERKDFAAMSIGGPAETRDERSLVARVQLSIVKQSFDQKLKWEFIYNGIRIAAQILDRNFYQGIDARTDPILKGDMLDVDLRTKQAFDPTLHTHVNKSYEIVRVHRHIELVRPEQRELLTVRQTKKGRLLTGEAKSRHKKPRGQ